MNLEDIITLAPCLPVSNSKQQVGSDKMNGGFAYMYRGFGMSSICSMEKRSVSRDSLQNLRGEPPGISAYNEREIR
jgi:hypothetical protein